LERAHAEAQSTVGRLACVRYVGPVAGTLRDMEHPDRPDVPEQLDRPYGDQEDDYLVIEPEGPEPEGGEPTGDIVTDEERAAAAEARAIGGAPADDDTDSPDEDWHGHDPAFQAVEEAGGGQAEGFEQSEALLIEHAGVPPDADRTADAFDLDDPGTDVDPDAEADVDIELSELERDDAGVLAQDQPDEEARRATGKPGEGDEIHSTEVTSDPDEGPDDPGQGPGITWER
jgi:hypothetical protein